jgi:hypothetical protein
MEYFAHVDTASDKLSTRCFDIVHYEVEARRRSRTELNRAWRARRRELYGARPVGPDKIGVQPPAQILVKTLAAVDIRNWNDRNFELHIESLARRNYYGCHDSLHEIDKQFLATAQGEGA